jgi:hypothetical protein
LLWGESVYPVNADVALRAAFPPRGHVGAILRQGKLKPRRHLSGLFLCRCVAAHSGGYWCACRDGGIGVIASPASRPAPIDQNAGAGCRLQAMPAFSFLECVVGCRLLWPSREPSITITPRSLIHGGYNNRCLISGGPDRNSLMGLANANLVPHIHLMSLDNSQCPSKPRFHRPRQGESPTCDTHGCRPAQYQKIESVKVKLRDPGFVHCYRQATFVQQ